ncbi:MAG: phage holin family protein [Gemmatimonadaceae bacterium]|nr:phage holin family protein [Gemmatimonadaceae bacterium]NUO93458.1 phage holin family protein [Gemmatimonadaceae bacterium]NUP70760.1 phage holin family protein [Gemmatimonadaceae bacterium]NUR33108.1 phage holin family protein [Gemmatimonadaceae bacterium]NUS32034.1 phage holin family protein [Gemmatimonadaceae bacterium]
MTVDIRSDGRRGLGALLRDLAEGSAGLVRGEVRLARLELGTAAAAAGRGTAFVAVGGVLLLLGTLATFTGIILLIGDQWLPRDLYWVGALLFVIVTGGIAAWLANRGRSMLSPAALAPHETVATLKEDKEWLKHPLTSGATSS